MTTQNFSDTPDAVSQLKETAANLGQVAGEKLDNTRNAAADRLATAAERLHGRASDLPGGERVAGVAHGAADKLNATAGYLREHNVSAMYDDVKTLVKRNPVPALIGAAALGFLLAKVFSRD